MIPSTSNHFGVFFTIILGGILYFILKIFGVENSGLAIGIPIVIIIIYITIKNSNYLPYRPEDEKVKDEGIDISTKIEI